MPAYKRKDAQAGDIIIFKPNNILSHCGLVVNNTDVIHATGKGMVKSDLDLWGATSDVYRPKSLQDAMKNDLITMAERLMESGTKYGVARAGFKSWTGTSSFGSGARGRLAKYRSRLIQNGQEHQGVVKNVYCSEFVVICYQLACADENARHFIKLDAKHTMPKTLRNYLVTNQAYWGSVGEFTAQ